MSPGSAHSSFHTIKSILNLIYLLMYLLFYKCFHTIKSILNGVWVDYPYRSVGCFHTIKSILNLMCQEQLLFLHFQFSYY